MMKCPKCGGNLVIKFVSGAYIAMCIGDKFKFGCRRISPYFNREEEVLEWLKKIKGDKNGNT